MSVEQLEKLLSDRVFVWKDVAYRFLKCKRVSGNMMIMTHKRTIQVSIDKVDEWLEEIVIEQNASVQNTSEVAPASALPVEKKEPKFQASLMYNPESFLKISAGLDKLLDELSSTDMSDFENLEKKARVLTLVSQTIINMEKTKLGISKLINKI